MTFLQMWHETIWGMLPNSQFIRLRFLGKGGRRIKLYRESTCLTVWGLVWLSQLKTGDGLRPVQEEGFDVVTPRIKIVSFSDDAKRIVKYRCGGGWLVRKPPLDFPGAIDPFGLDTERIP